ncbi:MAG: cyclase family protein [Armatimonadota bacterium]
MFSLDLQRYRLVDLSVTIEPPGTEDRPLEVSIGRLADDTFKTDISRLHSHVGTHVEAPAHFYEEGTAITDVPLDRFFGPAALLSIDDAADRVVTGEVLDRHLSEVLEPGYILLCRNGLQETRETMQGIPTLTPDAGHWMVDHEVKLLVVDCWFGLGRDVPDTRELHDIVMSEDICIVEFAVLDELRRDRCFFISLPVAFAMDSSFTRAVALEER